MGERKKDVPKKDGATTMKLLSLSIGLGVDILGCVMYGKGK
jgi:hypothetical protein